jgi:hypothetical protein
MRRFLLRAVERRRPGPQQLQIYHTDVADAASEFVAAGNDRARRRRSTLRESNGQVFAAPRLTGAKIFIYGIPEKISSWLAALMLW